MSHLLDRSYGIGLHRYNPAKFPGAVFLDVADAQYNPLNPEEIVAGIHPARTPGTYGVAKFKGDAVLAETATPYKWDSSLEPYIRGDHRTAVHAEGAAGENRNELLYTGSQPSLRIAGGEGTFVGEQPL